MTIEQDVATNVAALVGALTYAENCRPGPIRPASDDQSLTGAIPEECVFVLETGGLRDLPFVDGGAKGAIQNVTVQVMIRSKTRDYAGGKTLADAVQAALDKTPPPGAEYVECRTASPRPGFVAQDETDHYLWSINATLTLCV